MSQSGERWAVGGGGLLGMTLAHRLAQSGRRVTLFEAADHLGGLAAAWELGGVVWDRHYHVTLLSDLHLRALWAELGLAGELRWTETRTGFYTGGRLHSLSSSLEFLRFPPLGLLDKLRLAATILHASRIKDPGPLEAIPVADWLRRWSGDRTFETIWLPLLKAKLGEHYRQTSAAFLWATIARLYAARRTGLKKEMFGYVPGGTAIVEMSTLVDRAELGGNALVYLPKYVDPHDPAFALSDDEIRETFLAALEKMIPTFDRGDLLCFRVSRVKHVFALPTFHYSQRLPPRTTSVPGLHLVNSAHIVHGTLNVNETVRLANRAAEGFCA